MLRQQQAAAARTEKRRKQSEQRPESPQQHRLNANHAAGDTARLDAHLHEHGEPVAAGQSRQLPPHVFEAANIPAAVQRLVPGKAAALGSAVARCRKNAQEAYAVTVLDTYCSTRRLRSLVS
jgi:hypothetical protein